MTRRAGGLEPPKRIEGITPRTGQTVAHSSTIRHPFMKPYIISTSFLQGTGMTMIPLDAAMAKHCASPCLLRALPEIRNLTTQPSPSASTISSIVIATLPSLIPPPLLRRKDLRIFWNFCDCRWPDRSGQSSSKIYPDHSSFPRSTLLCCMESLRLRTCCIRLKILKLIQECSYPVELRATFDWHDAAVAW